MKNAENLFSLFDYVIFSIILLGSSGIAVYFGCFRNQQSSANEYLLGSRSMKLWPVAISLSASQFSGMLLMAIPTDVYQFGAAFGLTAVSLLVVPIVTIFVYLPVLYGLRITSVYQYLEQRFDYRSQMFSSFAICTSSMLAGSLIIYLPATALSSGTGVSADIISVVVCIVCIFYTSIGGLKTVVWTDVLQCGIMLAAMLGAIIAGIQCVGFEAIWKNASEGERLNIFNFDVNLTLRDSFWIYIVGYTIHCISVLSVSQNFVQKYLAVETFSKSAWSIGLLGVGGFIYTLLAVLMGLVMYAKYSDCDPVASQKISRINMLVPYFIIDVSSRLPGLPGLFVAGVFSAAISTYSSILNSNAAIIYTDFVKKFLNPNVSQQKKSIILKLIVLTAGLISICITFVIKLMGGIWPLFVTTVSIGHAPALGLITLGLFSKKANSTGAFYGILLGTTCSAFIIIKAKIYELQGFVKLPLNISTDFCEWNYSLSATENENVESSIESPSYLFRISFYYYSFIGAALTAISALIISHFTKENKPLDQACLHSIIKCNSKPKHVAEYSNIEHALEAVD